ncbi:MAG: hypothetical protein ACYC3X_20675 [Pirellulaceae bacterium]
MTASVSVLRDALTESPADASILGQALVLGAEAQSALRCAVSEIGGRADSDQTLFFNWIRQKAEQESVFIERFMRTDDQADSLRWPELLGRIETLRATIDSQKQRRRRRKRQLSKARYLLSGKDQTDDKTGRWRDIAATLDEMVRDGVPPSALDIRKVLLPYVESIPSDLEMPHGFQLVLRELERIMAGRQCEVARRQCRKLTEAVKEVAKNLRGRSLVLIGGDCRPNAQKALMDAFGLTDLYWIETRHGQSVYDYESYVARPDVAAVLLAIRWSPHGASDVSRFCVKYGKPLVRLPTGYNPNQVAAKLLKHCARWSRDQDGVAATATGSIRQSGDGGVETGGTSEAISGCASADGNRPMRLRERRCCARPDASGRTNTQL